MTAKEMIKTEKSNGVALSGKALEDLVIGGDLSVLSPADKVKHYIALCESLGLNPAAKPFAYVRLQGKEVLYALRECTDQLRKIHSVSIEIVSRNRTEDVYMVTARATLPDGRKDESMGVLSVAGLKGENLANALMKCETKAKRRVTLSICGLGMPDESELEGVDPDRFAELEARTAPAKVLPADAVMLNKDGVPTPKPPATVITMPTPPAAHNAEPKPSEGLPDAIPEHIGMIPAAIMLAYHAKLNGLGGVKLEHMSDDDLQLVIETMTAAYETRKASGKTSPHGLAWFKAIAEQSQGIINERTNPAPPPPDDRDFNGEGA
jgi:hypothetical protein